MTTGRLVKLDIENTYLNLHWLYSTVRLVHAFYGRRVPIAAGTGHSFSSAYDHYIPILCLDSPTMMMVGVMGSG